MLLCCILYPENLSFGPMDHGYPLLKFFNPPRKFLILYSEFLIFSCYWAGGWCIWMDVFTYKKLSFLSLQIETSQHRRSALLIIYFHYNNSPDSQDDKTLLLAGNFFTENNSQLPYKDLLFWDINHQSINQWILISQR